jgi:hypothetical protein
MGANHCNCNKNTDQDKIMEQELDNPKDAEMNSLKFSKDQESVELIISSKSAKIEVSKTSHFGSNNETPNPENLINPANISNPAHAVNVNINYDTNGYKYLNDDIYAEENEVTFSPSLANNSNIQIKNTKKPSKNIPNSHGNKAPLEIINEMNGELSKDSFRDNEARRAAEGLLGSNGFKNMKNKTSESQLKVIEEKRGQGQAKNSNINSKRSNSPKGQNIRSKSPEGKETDTVLSSYKGDDKDIAQSTVSRGITAKNPLNTGYNTIQVDENNKDKSRSQSKEKDYQEGRENKEGKEKPRHQYQKFVKKIIDTNKELDQWRNILITSIIPENKLLTSEGDEILFQGNLSKFTHQSSKAANSYSSKFCVLTRSEFKIFRSKEVFLLLEKPLAKYPLFNISATNRINNIQSMNKKEQQKKYFHFFIELITMGNNQLLDNTGKANFDTSLSKIGNSQGDINSK